MKSRTSGYLFSCHPEQLCKETPNLTMLANNTNSLTGTIWRCLLLKVITPIKMLCLTHHQLELILINFVSAFTQPTLKSKTAFGKDIGKSSAG